MKAYHVHPGPDRTWVLRRSGSKRATRRYAPGPGGLIAALHDGWHRYHADELVEHEEDGRVHRILRRVDDP